VRTAVEQAGRLDVAINNAAYALVGLARAITGGELKQECIAPFSSGANEEIRGEDAVTADREVSNADRCLAGINRTPQPCLSKCIADAYRRRCDSPSAATSVLQNSPFPYLSR
jgi:hypothetical protein